MTPEAYAVAAFPPNTYLLRIKVLLPFTPKSGDGRISNSAFPRESYSRRAVLILGDARIKGERILISQNDGRSIPKRALLQRLRFFALAIV